MKHYKVMKHSDCSGKVMKHGELEIKNLSSTIRVLALPGPPRLEV